MSTILTADAERLARRLRMLADEIESASRYAIPIPSLVSVSSHKYGQASFSATQDEFAAWAAYTEADVEQYDYDGSRWSRATADVNGLPMEFSTRPGAAVTA